MNILQVISGRSINGALTYCKYLSEMLADRGHSVTILCREDNWLEERGVDGVHFFNSELSRSPGELKRIAEFIRSKKIDLVHTHMSRAHVFGALLKFVTGTPLIATAHNRSMQMHWRFNDFVIANSQSTLDYQRRFNRVNASRIERVLCFTELERFRTVEAAKVRKIREQMRVRDGELLIGCVGEVTKRKGQLYLMRALKQIAAHLPEFKLAILGKFERDDAYSRKVRGVQVQNELYGRVKWLGLRMNVEDYMSAFDLLVVPSVKEPLGLVAAEALAAGTPVIASRTGGLPEIVQHEKSGILVPSRNPAKIAEAVIRLAGDPDLRQSMGEHGKTFAFQQFENAKLCDRVESIYQKVLAGARNMVA